jgi:gliding motility-associated-like protein
MLPTLLRRVALLPRLVLLLLALGAARPALATHLLGGEMTYRYLDANGPAGAPLRYQITVTIYNNTNAGAANPNTDAPVGIYDLKTGARINLVQGLNVLAGSGAVVPATGNLAGFMDITAYTISPNLNPGTLASCPATSVSQTFRLQKFTAIVNLPVSADGYYALFTRSARNVDVKNLNTANNNASLVLYSTLSPQLTPNRSPIFSDTAVAVVCQGDTTIVLNNAVDPDGDRLVYAFGTPYGSLGGTLNGVPPFVFPLSGGNSGTPVVPTLPYYGGAGYSANTPFGTTAGNYATLNANTGTAKYLAAPRTLGSKYVVAVDVSEYRTVNGRELLIGTTRRDLQLVVGDCPATASPVLPPVATTPRSYTVEAGGSLSIPLTVTQADGHPLTLTLNSALLDGAGGFNTTFNGSAGTVVPGNFTGTATAKGTGGRVSGTFVYNSACGEARATPYDVAFTAKDNACGGKLVADVLRITVTRPAGPTAISGDAVVCNLNTATTYRATGGTAPTVRWRVVGGTIVGAATGSTVQVSWTTPGTGTLVAKGVSQYGCLTDSVSRAVTVAPAGTLSVAGGATVCQGASVTLTATGSTAPYTLTGGGLSQTGPGTFTVTPTSTTTYTLSSSALVLGCTPSQQVTVVVNPLPAANVGLPTRATCPGVPLGLGAAPVAGFAYRWSPATGLSSPAVANPTLTLPNPTGTPVTSTYTLTLTNLATGCVGTGTVAVTVNPAALAAAGPAQAVCDGGTITLGTAAQPGYTYQWTPARLLSSSTAAQPVLTGVNLTGVPLVQQYVVLATTAQGCTSKDSVLITINPRPATDSLTGPQSVCPTVADIAYSIKNPRSTAYHWTVVGGTIASGQGTAAITVNWGAAGTGAVRATATTAQGCTSSAFTLPVLINRQLQTATPTGPTSVCQADGPYAYQTLLANGSSYAWQLFGAAQGTLVSTLNTTIIRFTTAGLAKLVATETSNPAGGICRGVSDTLYITVKPSPLTTLVLQGAARFCVGSGPQTYTLPGGAGSSYVFQLNGAALANASGSVTIPASTAVGTYTLTARETNAGGCVGPLYTKVFTVDPRPGAPTISGPRFVCPAARTLTYTVANALASSTFQWAVTGATLTAGQGTATSTVSFPAGTTTSATVSVVETSQYGCAGAPTTITVVPDDAQAPLLTLASVVATDNTRVALTFAVASPTATPNPVRVLRREAGSPGTFTQVGTVAATATTFVDATASAAQTAYEYSLALTNGCGDVLPGPSSHTTVLLKALAGPGPGGRDQGTTRLSWSAYQGFPVAGYRLYQQNDNGGYRLLHTLAATTLQAEVSNTVQASSGTGFNQCFRVVAFSAEATPRESNSNTACVDYANKTAFYNIITPNGDGQNDLLIIDNVQLYPGNSLAVFNRWGREVYRTTSYNNTTNAWGADPGIAAGTYYYLFKLPDGTATKGWVEVVK